MPCSYHVSPFLLHKLKEALHELREHWQTLEEMEVVINEDDPMVLAVWEKDVICQEDAHKDPNPYESKVDGELIVLPGILNPINQDFSTYTACCSPPAGKG